MSEAGVLESGTATALSMSGPSGNLDRRADIDSKQEQITKLLAERGWEGLLLMEPANVAWFTSGATVRGLCPDWDQPAVLITPTQRWLLASNAESQRLFDEELDGLGFMLKEWQWDWRRDYMLRSLAQAKRLASDRPYLELPSVADWLAERRRCLTAYEQACSKQLAEVVVHAVEAACRNCQPRETEREVAGQVAHRLLRRGAWPLHISVSADGRSQRYRRQGFTAVPIERWCVVSATARKYGLHVSATRTVSFGPVEPRVKEAHANACKVQAALTAASWPDAIVGEVFQAARRIYGLIGAEHEWHSAPIGYVLGREPVEAVVYPDSSEAMQAGWTLLWSPSVGPAITGDTILVTPQGPVVLTSVEAWPIVLVRVSGMQIQLPGILER
ncbi:MAG: M24 family metallopeptidase [Gemmatales bacterium]|nr:M24 family metallopeptidase [Gemmatales bacterium]MDW8221849.1 M24 family metallopeptidase [Gemmatales bacterium]